MRAGEICQLRCTDINFDNLCLTVGRSETADGEGRTIPINPDLQNALQEHREWFVARFGSILPDWYVFPESRSNESDPTRPVTTLKTAWTNLLKRAGVKGRLHDARHTFITEFAESGVGDQAILDLAGHVSPQMVKHYSYLRMQTKRDAMQQIWLKQQNASTESQATAPPKREHREKLDALAWKTVRRHLLTVM